ncbi:MAG: dTDP-4-dehydrorhamnose reductase [Casimicrobiaceae bacterium]
MPTILLTGAAGQVGFELARTLSPHGNVVACDRSGLDLADRDAIVELVRATRPQLIVNAAAYTAVDRAESEPEQAQAINATAPGVLAEEARRLGATLIHFSTDYVFDGTVATPYDEQAPTRPLGVYGQTKLAGEQAIAAAGGNSLIFRTSWVYGLRGGNFLLTMRRLAAEREELRVVADQIGVPNWCRTLAEAMGTLVGRGVPYLAERAGVYHLSATGSISWYEFARAIIGDVARPRVVPITTAQYPTPAKRPAYAVLATTKFERSFGFALPPWRDSLAHCLER